MEILGLDLNTIRKEDTLYCKFTVINMLLHFLRSGMGWLYGISCLPCLKTL